MEEKKNYQDIDESFFDNEILKGKDKIYIVVFNNGDFALNNLYDDIVWSVTNDFIDIKFCRGGNIECEKIIERLGIRTLPTLLIYKNREIIGNIEGIVPKFELKKYLHKILDRKEE